MSKTLFDIGGEYLRLYESVDDSGELNAELEKLIDDLATEEARKLDGYSAIIHQCRMEESAAKAMADQYQAKARARANLEQRLKSRIKEHLEKTGRKKVLSEKGTTFAIQANGGSLPVVIAEGTDPESVPMMFTKIVTTIDEKAVAKALAAGDELTWAKMGERGSHLRIRT
jgi:hypothetical protein